MRETEKQKLLRAYNKQPDTERGALVRMGMEIALRQLNYDFEVEDASKMTSPATAIVEAYHG